MTIQNVKTRFVDGRLIHVSSDGKELIDEDGQPYEDISEFDGFCTNYGKFQSLSDADKKKWLRGRTRKEDVEKKREIDSISILPPELQDAKKKFDVKSKNFKM